MKTNYLKLILAFFMASFTETSFGQALPKPLCVGEALVSLLRQAGTVLAMTEYYFNVMKHH